MIIYLNQLVGYTYTLSSFIVYEKNKPTSTGQMKHWSESGTCGWKEDCWGRNC